ncbi:hypothetical protein SteCoe_6573 [Stentor coeruleus]|uniref:Bromo domain-containing protein n=1 Tax=Stentor coeruleus TaxID=5963 RepID=A0A1R2CPR6_9CILI|nr:hypothetical protein SteCoe_21977 [Stentor coeruleus]OMJ90999.1 hypothetical protein SteCoe_6573 [Stentor coeruleus]
MITRRGQQNAKKLNLDQAERLIQYLINQDECVDFLYPVNPEKLGIPLYKEIIKNPMDMNTISIKIKQSKYSNIDLILEDIKLIWDNCRTFNQKGSEIFIRANTMEEKCKEYCRVNNIKNYNKKNGGKNNRNLVLPTKHSRQNKEIANNEEPLKEKTKTVIGNRITRKTKDHVKKNEIPKIDKFFKKTDKNTCGNKSEIKVKQKIEKKVPDPEPEIVDCVKSQSFNSETTEKLGDFDELNGNEVDDVLEKPKMFMIKNQIPYGQQVELRRAIMNASAIDVKKIIQITKEKEPKACEIVDDNLCIYIEKLRRETFEELWNIVH